MKPKNTKMNLEGLSSKPTTASMEVIIELFLYTEAHPAFRDVLVASLKEAANAAQTPPNNLDSLLYDALQWPETFDAYLEYLIWFANWPPQQSSDPAWLEPGSLVGEHQEVYDRLCHFYYLIDQPVESADGVLVQDTPWFSGWLVRYANAWGSFLNSTESFNDQILQTFINDSPMYQVENSMIDGAPNNPSGWLTFNQFFARELNPGLRPITTPGDNRVVVAPADSTFRAFYPIDGNSEIPQVTMKGTHNFASIPQLIEGSQYSNSFANGTFAHYFLGPYSYHRFHTPVAGLIRESFAIQGKVFLDVNVTSGQFDAPDNSEGGYEFSQARGVITIDTTDSPFGDVGIIAVIPVGMCQVSSVHMIATPGTTVRKGEEFGYFLFGGSDIIVLFQEGIDPRLFTLPEYLHYGDFIAYCKSKTTCC